MEKISLIQPRHNGAPLEGKGHIYLPSSLSTVAARILTAGGQVSMQDANMRPAEFDTGIVGVNVVGAPYIPIAIELRKAMTEALGNESQLILGGQVISGLSTGQFQRLFPSHTSNGNDDRALAKKLGLDVRALPTPEQTDLTHAYEKISDADFKQYMEHEFCMYLSQGCLYECSFCAAFHTHIDPVSGNEVRVTERYRNFELVEKELTYLFDRARRLGIFSLDIYLSNLDTFQTPEKLKEFAQIVVELKKSNPDFSLRMRGLATAAQFMLTYKKDKKTIETMVDAGLWSIGFGVDGTSKESWKQVRKGQNTLPQCIEAIRLTREEFAITPEVFMVIGHDKDTTETLLDDVSFVLDMNERFGAAPRPYVSKSVVPGNEGWRDAANSEIVEKCMQDPRYFNALDYAALPTQLTHPNTAMHQPICDAYQMLLSVPGNTTNIVFPDSPDLDDRTQEIHRRLNRGKFDR